MVQGGDTPDAPKPVEYSGLHRLKVKALIPNLGRSNSYLINSIRSVDAGAAAVATSGTTRWCLTADTAWLEEKLSIKIRTGVGVGSREDRYVLHVQTISQGNPQPPSP